MQAILHARFLAAALLLAAPLAAQSPAQPVPQSAARPTPPVPALAKPATVLPPAAPTSAAPVAPTSAASVGHRAKVTWEQGQLKIEANNSSLNGILRDVSMRTGMKITGGVEEERVFGSYGPGTAAVVLQQLMDGTPCNMVLQSDRAMIPLQLTLTPLSGKASPPSPMQSRNQQEDEDDPGRLEERPSPPVRTPQPASPLPPQAQPDNSPNNNNTTATPQDGTSDQPSNGAKTPQQVLEQLRRLQSQRQQPQ